MADLPTRHIVLVGLPGCGKSTVGARLARQLGRPFLDFDVEIARREAMSIIGIFAEKGELHFRGLEQALTAELLEREAMVLSPGGGWVSQPDTLALLRPRATLVYLRLSPAATLKRMGSRVEARPLLQGPDPRGELERLLAARRGAYESADFVVDVEHLYPQRVADLIASLVAP